MILEGDNAMHRVEGGVSKLHNQVLFILNPDGESGGKNMRNWLKEHCLSEVDIIDREHGRRH